MQLGVGARSRSNRVQLALLFAGLPLVVLAGSRAVGHRPADPPNLLASAVLRPNGDARVSGSFKGAPIVVSTSHQFAGAISSLTWNGMEFINSSDHGRELQSAVQLDGGGEDNNPTEAGSATDRATSSSVLRALGASGNVLHTQAQMAYWRPFHFATVSDVTLKKQVTVGFAGIPNVIEDAITFSLPSAHVSASFEGLTGYMPPAFSTYSTYAPATKTLAPIANPATLAEEPLPIIVSTPDGRYAMGSYAHAGIGHYNYAYWAFPGNTSKWDCGVSHVGAIPAGDYTVICYVIVGSLADVQTGIDSVHAYFNPGLVPTPQSSSDDEASPAVAAPPAL